MLNLIALIIAYLFSDIKSPAQFQRTAPAAPRRRATRKAEAQPAQRTILVNWPDGRATVLVM
ncbi:MAG: hypothetical protein FOGNACKC_06259 [Anaerolineae bacterium]|nr:hypothetical protein [Anaerolineae bacterium]